MKQPTDTKTMELPMPGAKRGRGRPSTGTAMTSAERQKAYRDRVKNSGGTRAPRNAHEEKFEMDYTRPTWEEHNSLNEKFVNLETDLAAANMRIGELATSLVAMQNKRDDAIKTLEALRKENALLVDERAKAFKAMSQAREELESLRDGNDTTSQLAADLLRIEEEKRQLIEDKTTIAQQASALMVKVRELEAAAKKRNASRKNKTATESN